MPGRAWRTFLLKIWGHEVKENTAAVPDTYEAISRIPGVHAGAVQHPGRRGGDRAPSRLGGRRDPLPLSADRAERAREVLDRDRRPSTSSGRKASRWCSTTTREHWVKNQTNETRVVLIIDFNADMPFPPVNLYTDLRYNLIRRSAEVKAVRERAAIGVPPRNPPPPQMSQGLISMASHSTSPVNVDRK